MKTLRSFSVGLVALIALSCAATSYASGAFSAASTIGITTVNAIDKFLGTGTLSGSWTTVSGQTAPQIVSGQVEGGATGASSHAYYSGVSINPNQFASININTANATGCVIDVQVLTQPSAVSWYELRTNASVGSGSTLLLNKIISGAATTLATYTGVTLTPPFTLSAKYINGVVSGYLNNVALGAGISDSSFATGQPGMGVYVPSSGAALTDCQWNNFIAGNINIAPVSAGLTELQYFQSLNTANRAGTVKILIGHHMDYYPPYVSGFPLYTTYGQMDPCNTTATAANITVPAYLASAQCGGTSTGQAPAIGVVTFGQETPGAVTWTPDTSNTTSTTGLGGSPMNGIAAGQDMCANGIIPAIWGSVNNPNYTAAAGTPSVNIANVLTTSTAENTNLLAELDTLAGFIKQIPCVMPIRLMVEQNGNWNWFGIVSGNGPSGGTTTSAQQASLFQLMHDRLIADGATNLIFVWNVNAGVGNYTYGYPGDSYVDIISDDCYAASPTCGSDPSIAALESYKPAMPFWMYEGGCVLAPSGGVNVCDNSAYLANLLSVVPDFSAMIFWSQNTALSQQAGALAVMTNSQAITKAGLPAGIASH